MQAEGREGTGALSLELTDESLEQDASSLGSLFTTWMSRVAYTYIYIYIHVYFYGIEYMVLYMVYALGGPGSLEPGHSRSQKTTHKPLKLELASSYVGYNYTQRVQVPKYSGPKYH